MNKKLLMPIILTVILSTSVFAFSLLEWYKNTNNWVIGKVTVGKVTVVESTEEPIFEMGQTTTNEELFSFAVIGDSHIGSPINIDYAKSDRADEILKVSVSDINTKNVDFTIVIGDISNVGTLVQLQESKTILDGLNKPYYPVVGNHDNMQSDNFTAFKNVFGVSVNYVWDYKGFHFVFADATLYTYRAPYINWSNNTIDWLKADLQEHSQIPTFFISHYNIWNYIRSSGEPWGHATPAHSEEIRTILEENNNVIMAIAGHVHRFRYKFETIPYVTIGTGIVYPSENMIFHVYKDKVVSEPIQISNQTLVDYVESILYMKYNESIKAIINGSDSNKYYTVVLRMQLMDSDNIPPRINFVAPTINNNTITSNTSFEVNVTINETNLRNVTFAFNGTNYSFYDDNLVLMMNFDNVFNLGENYTGNGSRVVDLSKYSNNGIWWTNGTNEGTLSVWNNTGKYGGAFEFDGVDDHILINDSPSLSALSQITIAAWIKPNVVGGDNQRIITKTWPPKNKEFSFHISWNSRLQMVFSEGGGAWEGSVISSKSIQKNNWTYAVVTWNSTVAKIYINGVNKGRSNINLTINDQASNIFIGGLPTYTATEFVDYFNGTIDEIRIWNKSLSAEEVKQQYYANLNKYDADKWYLYINESNMVDGNYNFSACADDNVGNENCTGLRIFNVNTTLRCDIQPTMEEGETKTFTIYAKNYTVTVAAITDSGTIVVKFIINGETTKALAEGEIYLSKTFKIKVLGIMPNEAGDVASDIVSFCLEGRG